jgi:hypothetical protein
MCPASQHEHKPCQYKQSSQNDQQFPQIGHESILKELNAARFVLFL